MAELPKQYDFAEAEPRIQKLWADLGIFTYVPDDHKPVYSIDTPPPYVSAFHLHVGHGMSYAQAEFVARYKRMRGHNVFYPMGFDDNGLPTERYVEKKHHVNKATITREDFIKLCLAETKEGGENYKRMWTRLGISVDWSLLYSTIDPRAQRISQRSFIDLHRKGLVSQIDAPTTWCMSCQTAIAQAEFENQDMTSHFNDVAFDCEGKRLVIATTRPELIPACVALFAHPDDARYISFKAKKATVPLFDYDVPILFDEAVDKEKGTGLMMVCTFGDKDDVDKWHRYKLPIRVVFTKDGKLNELAGKYAGLKIKDGRAKILEALKENGHLLAQKDIAHAVNVHERCGTEIEFLKTKQWFINLIDHKEELLVAADKINWYPAHMKVRYQHWVGGLQWNWCISRQRFYGVPFPVWYSKKTGEIILPDDEQLPVDPMRNRPRTLPAGHTAEDIIAETDVMDTWATSSVTPLINAKWGDDDEASEIIPMSLRPQAHDIIRTWAFYTIAKSWFHHRDIPWRDIMMSGHGQDPKGKKMSKSKGNFIPIEDMLDKYGADAFRFWAASSKLGDDLPFQEKDLVTGKKMLNKMWNATKFAMAHLEGYIPKEPAKLNVQDQWILSKLHRIIKTSTASFDAYEYSRVKADVENFFWNTLCDNYLEMTKDILYNPEAHEAWQVEATKHTLYCVLRDVTKMLAPILPHITEELYQYFFKETDGAASVHVSAWPRHDDSLIVDEMEKIGDSVVAVISAARKAKSEKSMSLKVAISKLSISGPDGLKHYESVIKSMTVAESIEWGSGDVEVADGVNVSITL
ncbi:MAG: valine--tRNA ligase [Nanoarchaeota archaeon]